MHKAHHRMQRGAACAALAQNLQLVTAERAARMQRDLLLPRASQRERLCTGSNRVIWNRKPDYICRKLRLLELHRTSAELRGEFAAMAQRRAALPHNDFVDTVSGLAQAHRESRCERSGAEK